MWPSIAYVTSAFTLIAFLAAGIVAIYQRWLNQKERLIRQAPEAERAILVQSALEFFHVNTEGLTKEQKYHLALEQIRERARRFRITAIVIVIIAVLAAGVTVYALSVNIPGKGAANHKANEFDYWTRDNTEGGRITKVYRYSFSTKDDCLKEEAKEKNSDHGHYLLLGYGCSDDKPSLEQLKKSCSQGDNTTCLIAQYLETHP